MLDRPRPLPSDPASGDDLPLVMLAGTLCDGRLFAPVLDRLGRAASLPALGGADTAAAMADLILGNAPPRFSLCGFSLGANIALHVALAAPDRVARLALIGGNADRLAPTAAAARQAARQENFIARSWRQSVAASRHDDMALRRVIEDMAAATPPDRFRNQIAMSVARSDARPRLGELGMPTLVLCGAEDQICPPSRSIEIARLIAGARLLLVEDAGHYVPLERPDAVAQALSGWLKAPAAQPFQPEDTP